MLIKHHNTPNILAYVTWSSILETFILGLLSTILKRDIYLKRLKTWEQYDQF